MTSAEGLEVGAPIILKGGADAWASSGFVLPAGHLGQNEDTGEIRVGDGVSLFADLDLLDSAPAGGSGLIVSPGGSDTSTHFVTYYIDGAIPWAVPEGGGDNVVLFDGLQEDIPLGIAEYDPVTKKITMLQSILCRLEANFGLDNPLEPGQIVDATTYGPAASLITGEPIFQTLNLDDETQWGDFFGVAGGWCGVLPEGSQVWMIAGANFAGATSTDASITIRPIAYVPPS